ncbi:hypothetical protein DFH09DRAFT_1087295 [Mycena vulgaris]|nr:hypothetical protein DFH09DRAFT_1087295 [Mycena vulgaris]
MGGGWGDGGWEVGGGVGMDGRKRAREGERKQAEEGTGARTDPVLVDLTAPLALALGALCVDCVISVTVTTVPPAPVDKCTDGVGVGVGASVVGTTALVVLVVVVLLLVLLVVVLLVVVSLVVMEELLLVTGRLVVVVVVSDVVTEVVDTLVSLVEDVAEVGGPTADEVEPGSTPDDVPEL